MVTSSRDTEGREMYIIQDWVDAAIEQGYSASDYSVDMLNEIGAAMERAYTDWSWFEAGEKDSKEYKTVVAHFLYSEDAPSEKALVDAYAEGMVC
jgi:hypothetical protein